jgi:putative thioredoxin
MSDSPFIADVTLATFESAVVARSRDVPVLVDFWAAWCGPCQMLMPVLARLADEYRGRFVLAKVNSDEQPELASRYGVRSLPTVKVFRHGQVVDEFLGVQPENAIRALLDRHIPRASDALVGEATRVAQQGDSERALALLQQALQSDPGHDRVKVELARLLIAAARSDEAETVLHSLSAEARDAPATTALRAQLEFARIAHAARPLDDLLRAVAAPARDSAARYELAARYVVDGRHAEALDQLLEIVRTDRKFNDDAARKAMIAIFNLLGGRGELVNEYRRRLSLALN